MRSKDIRLVQQTWEQVKPISDTAAELFYTRLFELDPSLSDLFSGDMTEQRRRLMAMLDFVIGRLDNISEMVPQIEALGRRHDAYGVRDEHYETVGAALLWTLNAGLGEAFTDEVEAAWTSVYGALATTMQGKLPARAA